MSDKIFSVSNEDMSRYLTSLEPLLDRDDIIGYVAARNTRRLEDASFEHEKIRHDLINKYGKPILDDEGNDTGRVSLTAADPYFEKVMDKINESGKIMHDVTIFTLTFEEVKNKLTGREILQIDWMLDDD